MNLLSFLTAFTPNVLSVALSKYSRSPKYYLKRKSFCGIKKSIWFNFLGFISIKILQLVRFSGPFLSDSPVKSLNWLNNDLRFGVGLSVNILLPFVYVITEDLFIWKFSWTNEWMKVFVVEVSNRKCLTPRAKLVVTIGATNLLNIQKI